MPQTFAELPSRIARRLSGGATLWIAAPRLADNSVEMTDRPAPRPRRLGRPCLRDQLGGQAGLETLRSGTLAGDVVILVAGSAELEVNRLEAEGRRLGRAYGVGRPWPEARARRGRSRPMGGQRAGDL